MKKSAFSSNFDERVYLVGITLLTVSFGFFSQCCFLALSKTSGQKVIIKKTNNSNVNKTIKFNEIIIMEFPGFINALIYFKREDIPL